MFLKMQSNFFPFRVKKEGTQHVCVAQEILAFLYLFIITFPNIKYATQILYAFERF